MTINRVAGAFRLIVPAVVLFSIWGGLEPFSALMGQERRNVLFISADDLNATLGCLGDPVVQTPHIDRLARRGTLFERAYCQLAHCNPSRSSVLTGLRPDTLRIWRGYEHFRETQPDVVTLPEHFKRHGYFVQGIGKIFHNGSTKIQADAQSWSVPEVMHWDNHQQDRAQGHDPVPPNLATTPQTERRQVDDDAYFDGRIAAAAVSALREMKQRPEPFFLAVGFWKPHRPFNPPDRYWSMYDRAKIPLPAQSRPPLGAPALAVEPQYSNFTQDMLSEEAVRELRHGYYAAISYLDAQVGRVLAELDRLDLAKSTVVVFWSDHGLNVGEHGLWGKTSCFETDARVPLVIATPDGVGAGNRTKSLVELVDLYPTVVALCDLPRAAGKEGYSLVSLLRDPQSAGRAAAFTQSVRPYTMNPEPRAMGYSLRTEHVRYTEWREWKTGMLVARELYDHRRDPDETFNRVEDPAFRADVSRLTNMLAAHYEYRRARQTPPAR